MFNGSFHLIYLILSYSVVAYFDFSGGDHHISCNEDDEMHFYITKQ